MPCSHIGNTRPRFGYMRAQLRAWGRYAFLYSCGPQPAGVRGVCGSTRALLSERRGQGHVAASEPTSTGRRGPELKNTWHRRSSTQQGDEARGHGTRGSTASRPTSVGRYGPKLQFAWQRVDARPAPCLDLKLVCGGTRSSRCRQRRIPTNHQQSSACRMWIFLF
jgi:hypothetical protein